MGLIERNPQKDFRFGMTLAGVDTLLFQKVTVPVVSFGEATHGAGGDIPDIPSAGKPAVGDLIIEKVLPITRIDYDFWAWYTETLLGLPSGYKSGTLRELKPALGGTQRSFDFTGAFPSELSTSDLSRQGTDNLLEIVTIKVHLWVPSGATVLKQVWGV